MKNNGSFGKGNVPWNKGKRCKQLQGKLHYLWKGDKAGYTALHEWVNRHLGSPNKCAKCGSTNRTKYEWANISKEYKRELTDWVRLCIPCHRILDGRNRPVNQLTLGGVFVKRWNSMNEAQNIGGFNFGCISLCCQKKRKTHANYKWAYV